MQKAKPKCQQTYKRQQRHLHLQHMTDSHQKKQERSTHAFGLAHLNHAITISPEEARYTITRYPFPPFIMRFECKSITATIVKEMICKNFEESHQVMLEILNFRPSLARSIHREHDLIIYGKGAVSFLTFLCFEKWPDKVRNDSFTSASSPSIPPQLSLIIKNVDLNVDFDKFCSDAKCWHPGIINIIRMKNEH